MSAEFAPTRPADPELPAEVREREPNRLEQPEEHARWAAEIDGFCTAWTAKFWPNWEAELPELTADPSYPRPNGAAKAAEEGLDESGEGEAAEPTGELGGTAAEVAEGPEPAEPELREVVPDADGVCRIGGLPVPPGTMVNAAGIVVSEHRTRTLAEIREDKEKWREEKEREAAARPPVYGQDRITVEVLNPPGRAWWESFLIRYGHKVRDHEIGDVDLEKSLAVLPRNDVSCALMVMSLLDGWVHFNDTVTWRLWDGRVHMVAPVLYVEGIFAQFALELEQALDCLERECFERPAKERMLAALDRGVDKKEARADYAQERKEWTARLRDWRDYVDRILDDGGQRALCRQVKIQAGTDEAEFDSQETTRWLVCGNGVLDLDVLRAGGGVADLELLPHSRDRLVTVCTEVEFDPEAECAGFDRFIGKMLPDGPGAAKRAYVRRFFGSSVFGQPRGKALGSLIGESDTGKSTLMNIVRWTEGGYGGTVPQETLSTRGNTFMRHGLRAKRFVTCSEPSEGMHFDHGFTKEVTGGDPITTRPPYGQYTTWISQCLICIGSNHPMKLDTSDVALMNRLRPIGFDVVIPKADQDKELAERLVRDEGSGVLNWLLEGAVESVRLGLGEEPWMAAVKEEMADEVDNPLACVAWGLEEMVLIQDRDVPAYLCAGVVEMYRWYGKWCRKTGERRLPQRKMVAVLARRYPKVRSDGFHFKGLVPGPKWWEAGEATDGDPGRFEEALAGVDEAEEA